MVKVVLIGKEHSFRFTRWYGSFRMGPFVKGPQQCFNCQKFGHHTMTCSSEIQTWRYCTGRHHSYQCQDNKQLTLKSANCGHEHATTSRLCPKRMEAEKKANNTPASHRTTQKQDSRKPAPIPLAIAWATLTVHEVTLFIATINFHNNTRNHQATNGSKYNSIPKTMQNRKSERVMVVPTLQQTTNAWTQPFVPSIMEFPVATSANRTKRCFSPIQSMPTNWQATNKPRKNKWTMY